MGLYIKGMEMPKCCRECDAEGHYDNSYGDEYGFFCPFGYKAYTSETRELKRLDNCPLVPVPPHGRLIDADAYESLLRGVGDRNYRREKGTICDAIKFLHPHYAPTIIPADPAEEGET